MLLSRKSDEREQRLLRQGHGWFHVAAMGHEALAAVGVLMQGHDYLAGYYRDRPIAVGKGVSLQELASAFHATSASSSGGRQMPSHFSNRSLGIFSPSSSIASSLLPGCGLAWGLKLDAISGVVVATVGDAGTRQGDFYEAIALARDWQLPMLFLVEDNGLGISTDTAISNPLHLGVLNPSLWHVIDGCDAQAVFREVEHAMQLIRDGKGPCFLWLKLERLSSHTSNDDHSIYRSPQELIRANARDPLLIFRQQLVANGEIDHYSFEQLENSIFHDVELAYDRSLLEESPPSHPANHHTSIHECIVPPLLHDDWPQEMTMAKAVNQILCKCLAKSPDVVLFGEDIEDPLGGVFRLTKGLSGRFPGRVRNSPLAESSIVGAAVGLAAYGKRPIVELQFIDYIFPGLQHFANHLASLEWRSQGDWSVPAVFYAPCGAYLPAGGMWHSQSLASLLLQFPSLQVAIPSSPDDAMGLFWTAIHSIQPTFILLPKQLLWKSQPFAPPLQPLPFGSARIWQKGNDLTIVTWGNGVDLVVKALQSLQKQHSIELIDLRSLAPIDLQAVLSSVRKTRRLMVVQEELEICSVGQHLVSSLLPELPAHHLLRPPCLLSRLPFPIGFHPALEEAVLPSLDDIITAIHHLLELTPVIAQSDETDMVDQGRVEVRVPVLGEGLAGATVLKLYVEPQSAVCRDQLIADIETDKAVFQVEAPADGLLECWHVSPGQWVNLHAALATIVVDTPNAHVPKTYSPSAQLTQLHGALYSQPLRTPGGLNWTSLAAIRRVVPAAAQRIIPWTPSAGGLPHSKRLTLTAKVAWALAQVMGSDRLRHALPKRLQAAAQEFNAAPFFQQDPSTDLEDLHKAVVMATTPSPDLGIAVSGGDGVLKTAVIPDVLNLELAAFHEVYRQSVKDALAGVNQRMSRVSWIVSSLGPQGPNSAIPVVVPPSFGTLFLHAENQQLSLWLSFDHRWITGELADHILRHLEQSLKDFWPDSLLTHTPQAESHPAPFPRSSF